MIKTLNISGKLTLAFLIALFFVSCKSKKIITSNTSSGKKLNTKTLVKNHYANTLDFKTIRGKMKIEYSDGSNSQRHTVSLRIEKDKAIWISATLGLVKAYITPTRVSFYNRLQNEYFDGDFSYLSKILGTDLDFKKVQNVLLGEALFNLKRGKYITREHNGQYSLSPKNKNKLFMTLLQIEPENYKVSSMQITQSKENRVLDIQYKNYQEVDEKLLPNIIEIYVKNKAHENNIALTFKNIEFNKKFKFPYKIPSGFKKIVLD